MFNLFGPQPSMYYPRQQYIRQPYRNYNPWDDDEDEDTYMAPSYGLSRRSPPRVQKRPQSSIRVVPHDDEQMTSRSRNQQMKKPVEQVHPFFGRQHRAQQYDSESDEEQNIHPLFSAPQRQQQLRIPPQYQQRQVQSESDSESEEEEMHPLFSSPQKQAQRSPQRSPPKQQLRIPPQFQKMIQKEYDREQIPVVQKKASPRNAQRSPSPKQVEQESQENVLEPAEEKPSTPQQVESAPQEQPVEQQPPTEPSEEDKLSEEERELRNSLQKISTISEKVDDLEKNVVALRQQCDTRPKPVEDEKYWWDIRKAEEMLTQQLLALDSVTGGDEVRKVRKEQVLRVQTLLNDVDQIRKASEPQKSE
jgi:hypothetical protein